MEGQADIYRPCVAMASEPALAVQLVEWRTVVIQTEIVRPEFFGLFLIFICLICLFPVNGAANVV